jgi:hypothetical protein
MLSRPSRQDSSQRPCESSEQKIQQGNEVLESKLQLVTDTLKRELQRKPDLDS